MKFLSDFFRLFMHNIFGSENNPVDTYSPDSDYDELRPGKTDLSYGWMNHRTQRSDDGFDPTGVYDFNEHLPGPIGLYDDK